MKKVIVVLILVLSMLLGACDSQQVPVQPTKVPSKVPTATIEPTATLEEKVESCEWSHESDPVKDLVLDLGEYGKFHTICTTRTEWITPHKDTYQCIMPLTWWRSIEPVSPPPAKKGDRLSFIMPATGYINFLGLNKYAESKSGELIPGSDLLQNQQILVDGEEYSLIGTVFNLRSIAISDGKDFLIPKGAKVELVALEDGLGGNEVLNGIVEELHFVKTCPDGTVYSTLSEETEIDMGVYGVFRPLYNEEANKWSLSFTEESIVKPGIWESPLYTTDKPSTNFEKLKDFMFNQESAITFVMPADGAIFIDRSQLTFSFYAGYTSDSYMAMELVAKDTLVFLYTNVLTDPTDFYIDFIN